MRHPLAEGSIRFGMNVIVFSIVLMAAVKFLGWNPRNDGGFVAPVMFGIVSALGQVWLTGRPGNLRAWGVILLACAGPWLVAVAFGPAGALLPAAARGCYVVTAALAVGLGLGQIRRRIGSGAGMGGEEVRLAALVAVPVWCFRPYLTPVFFGGIDARSYAYGMMDALAQARAGVFPVLVGQTEFMFEGVVHPIRTAPYHHYFGMLLDVVTLRALGPVAVEHLTVVVTAVLATLSCYICLALLAPAWRWLAWVMAVIYVSAPAVGGFVYGQEMYMTFMAFAWLPVVIFGNIRVIRNDDWPGWSLLAAGLAMVWFCHAPVGLWLTAGTCALQVFRLCLGGAGWAGWRRAVGGALMFTALSAGYFWSVAEIAGASEHAKGGHGMELACLGLAAIGLAAVPGLISLSRGGRYVPAIAAVILVLSGGLLAWRSHLSAGNDESIAIVQQLFPGNLRPLSTNASKLEDLQLGYALLAAWLVGVAALFRKSGLEGRLLAFAGLVGMCLLMPVPGLTRFLLDQVPGAVVAVSSVSLWLRYLPALATLCVFMGFLGVTAWAERRAGSGRLLTAMFCLAAAWSLSENGKYVRSAYRARESTGEHLDLLRPENVTQFAYFFPGMPASPYLVNGVVDYHLESRLLDLRNPEIERTETVPWSEVHWQTLAAVADARNATFLNLSPSFTLAPGEHRLMRFRFHDDSYKGVLVLRGAGGWYREYRLPEAGFGPKSFGVAPERPKTIALWNSGDKPQPVEMLFIVSDPASASFPGGFADIAMQSYDPAALPVRTLGLIPYRASVTLRQPAYLESPRAFIPGYQATANGRPKPVMVSPNHRVMVPLDAGESLVELRYAGTGLLWAAFGLSALAWAAFLTWAGWNHFRGIRWIGRNAMMGGDSKS